MSVTPADLETGTLNVFAASRTSVDKKTEPSLSGLRGLREVCGDACRNEDSGKHAPNPSWGLTPLNPSIVLEASAFPCEHWSPYAGMPGPLVIVCSDEEGYM